MTDSRHLTIRIAWGRAAVALLACCALAFGLLAPHDVVEERTGALSRVEIAESAVHPRAPAHFEDAEFKVHPGCPACLLQIQTGTALVRLPAALSLPSADRELTVPAERTPSQTVLHRSPARAPPVLSPSA